MGIFGDNDRRPRSRGEGREHLSKEPVTRGAVEGVLVNQEVKRWGQVAHGTERTWGGERVAGGPQDRGSAGDPAAELVGEGRLAHTGLAPDEHQAPLPRLGLAQMLRQVIQVRFALE